MDMACMLFFSILWKLSWTLLKLYQQSMQDVFAPVSMSEILHHPI